MPKFIKSPLTSLLGIEKAVIAGGFFSLPALPIIYQAIIAAFGIGEAPDPVALQEALISLIDALVLATAVYLVPNSTVEAPQAPAETNIKWE